MNLTNLGIICAISSKLSEGCRGVRSNRRLGPNVSVSICLKGRALLGPPRLAWAPPRAACCPPRPACCGGGRLALRASSARRRLCSRKKNIDMLFHVFRKKPARGGRLASPSQVWPRISAQVSSAASPLGAPPFPASAPKRDLTPPRLPTVLVSLSTCDSLAVSRPQLKPGERLLYADT